jgi:hypothetical protein
VTAEPRVADGARLLDLVRPGWEEKINIDELDMSSGRWCVLGQVYGSYAKAPPVDIEDDEEHEDFAFEHGFTILNDPEMGVEEALEALEELVDLWALQVELRR